MMNVLEVFAPLFIAIGSGLAVGLGIRAVCIHAQRSRESKADTCTPMSPTLQWMNTAGSILLADNNGNFRYMAGISYLGREENYQRMFRNMLWEYWEIQGHESAMEEMQSLLHTGMRARYAKEMQRLEKVYAGYSEEELIQEARRKNPKANEDSFLPKMLMAYRRYGENALLGWDAGRAAYLIQCCYITGYVSMEEVLEIGVEAGKKAQACFQNWEEMMESYLLGGQYWQREDAGDPQSMTAGRWKIYEALWKGKKPYKTIPYTTVAFDTPLSKEVLTDEHGIMPEYQKYYQTTSDAR